MNNYEHEVACPDNKGIRNYLWYDIFHDSKIDNISFDHEKGLVVLTMECCSDIDKLWDKFKNDGDSDGDAYDAYLKDHMDNFTYLLTFKGVQYFHSERIIMVNDYINGRFKDTALLRNLSAENKKPLYHFRIEIDDGYMDIIFSDFVIRKKKGGVKYPIDSTDQPVSATLGMSAFYGNDYKWYLTMQKLYDANDPGLLEIARSNLQLDSEHDYSCLYAAYLLGKLGDTSDIPKLFDLFLNVEEYFFAETTYRSNAVLAKRNIMDAIELIHHRCT